VNESIRTNAKHKPADSDGRSGITEPAAELGQVLTSGKVKGLFEQHYAALVRFLKNKLGSEHEAQDVAQEAYAKLLGLDDDKVVSHLQAYLYRVANNLAIDRLRKKKKSLTLHMTYAQGVEELTPSAGIENAVNARQRLQLIQQILKQLPPRCRQAFMLYKFDGMEYKDIAHQMNLTESMVRKYVLRAVRFCAEKLDLET
jgi:RNA polymerase sigma factor (sigma-70 family)